MGWIGQDVGGVMLRDLPPDCLPPTAQAIGEAMQTQAPVASVAYRVRNGVVESYELLSLPMACRWGRPMVAIYVHECGSRYDLVDGSSRLRATASLRWPQSVMPRV